MRYLRPHPGYKRRVRKPAAPPRKGSQRRPRANEVVLETLRCSASSWKSNTEFTSQSVTPLEIQMGDKAIIHTVFRRWMHLAVLHELRVKLA